MILTITFDGKTRVSRTFGSNNMYFPTEAGKVKQGNKVALFFKRPV
jgi:hypothetical protein